MTTTPLPPSDGWQLRLVYFQDGEPIMHQDSTDLEAENARMADALLNIQMLIGVYTIEDAAEMARTALKETP